jgi:hypothetical protein
MMVMSAVEAVRALAVLSTLETSAKTLAVLLHAVGFLAVASLCPWQVSGTEGDYCPGHGFLDGFGSHFAELLRVLAGLTPAVQTERA